MNLDKKKRYYKTSKRDEMLDNTEKRIISNKDKTKSENTDIYNKSNLSENTTKKFENKSGNSDVYSKSSIKNISSANSHSLKGVDLANKKNIKKYYKARDKLDSDVNTDFKNGIKDSEITNSVVIVDENKSNRIAKSSNIAKSNTVAKNGKFAKSNVVSESGNVAKITTVAKSGKIAETTKVAKIGKIANSPTTSNSKPNFNKYNAKNSKIIDVSYKEIGDENKSNTSNKSTKNYKSSKNNYTGNYYTRNYNYAKSLNNTKAKPNSKFEKKQTRLTKKINKIDKQLSNSKSKNSVLKSSLYQGAANNVYIAKKYLEQGKEDNSSVESTHFVLSSAESGIRELKNYSENKPYRLVKKKSKYEQRFKNNEKKLQYKENLAELKEKDSYHNTSSLNKFFQRKKLQNAVNKEFRDSFVDNIKRSFNFSIKKISLLIQKNIKRAIGSFAITLLVFIIVFQIFSNMSLALATFTNNILSTSYLSSEDVLSQINSAMTSLEEVLQDEIDNFVENNPGYDEYELRGDLVGHDVHELLSYITAKRGDVKNALDVIPDINKLFNDRYSKTYTTRTETRRRSIPGGGTETYQVTILTLTIINKSIDTIAKEDFKDYEMNLTHYQALLEAKGNFGDVFDGNNLYGDNQTDISNVVFNDGLRIGNPNIATTALVEANSSNNGGRKFWSWYGFSSRVEWCACFVSWCLSQNGYSEPKFTFCPSGINWFAKNGRWATRGFSDIAAGDLIFFDWNNNGSSDHVGIVIGCDNEFVYTVEGNSKDACVTKKYPLNSKYIIGYGLME